MCRGSSLLIFAALIALTAWGAMSIASRMNIGFQFSAEQLANLNKLKDCRSHFRPAAASTSTYMSPAEDIEVDLETDVAFMSVSDPHATIYKNNATFNGNIVSWRQSTENMIAETVENTVDKPKEIPSWAFNPLGISLLRYRGFGEKYDLWTFIVNYDHVRDIQSVLIYKHYYQKASVHGYHSEYVVKSDLFRGLNDVAAISPTEFYVTNHHAGPGSTGVLTILLDAINLPTGNVIYCNAETGKCRTVLDGIAFANSVYLNHDHTKLYLTETLERRFHVYDRDIMTNELSLNETIVFDSFLDNINVDPQNNIWVAGTMDLLATLRAMLKTTDEVRHAPSIVYRLVPKTGLPGEKPSKWNYPAVQSTNFWVEAVYADNGSSITPLSVAAPTRLGNVILGSIVAKDVVRCTIPDE